MKTLFDAIDLEDLSLGDIMEEAYVMIDKTRQSICYRGIEKFHLMKAKWINGGWILDSKDIDYPACIRELFFIKGKSVFSVTVETNESDDTDGLIFYLSSVSSKKYFTELQKFYKSSYDKKKNWHIHNELNCFDRHYIVSI